MSALRNLEIEIKLAVGDARAGRRLLLAAGFLPARRRMFEANTLYDFADGRLRQAGQLIRIRRYGSRRILTYKGPPAAGRHKVREEREAGVTDERALGAIFSSIGLKPTYRYEKYRTEFHRPGEPGTATLDETPMGVFLELEGPPRWIDRTARRLGFGQEDYITLSYATLWIQYCERRSKKFGDMVFH